MSYVSSYHHCVLSTKDRRPMITAVTSSVAKVADAGKGHGHLALISGGNHFGIAHGAPRLNCGGRAGFTRGNQGVGKRKEGVAANDATF
jgi:hypothetical protein